jgi:hypothetical protein
MNIKIYQCNKPKEIHIISPDDLQWGYSPMQFCIVNNYKDLYLKELPGFSGTTPYAIPGENKPVREYNGIDREPDEYTPENFDEYSESEVLEYYHQLDDTNLELIFYRVSGYEYNIPENMTFLGFDVGYPYGKGCGDGFSAICDCMFLSRWHGCDEEGVEFIEEYQNLNENGLFDSREMAEKYLYHYLNQEWAELGDFCIFEIYKPIYT